MPYMLVNGKRHSVGLVVFDKDGLMFKSQQFWKELGECRMRKLREFLPDSVCSRWSKVFGVHEQNGEVDYTDPKGAFAVAAPTDEMAVTAGMIVEALDLKWTDARALASEIYAKCDAEVDLSKALAPQDGLHQIFAGLKSAGIPYAVATSDTRDRVNRSMRMFSLEPPVDELIITSDNVENGKPNPDMLVLLSKRTNVPPENIVMVGDSYVDVQMAYNAGSIGIGIPETDDMKERMRPFATYILDSLCEITFEK